MSQTNKKLKPKLKLKVDIQDVAPESTHSSERYKEQRDIFFKESIDQFKPFSINGRTVADVAQLKGGRKYQEDRFVAIPNLNENQETQFFYAIYDGHAGDTVSAILEKDLHNYLIHEIKQQEDLQSSIFISFEKMNNFILSCQKDNQIKGGSTALCVINKQKDLYIINLGDSGCVIITENYNIKKLNQEHKLNREDEIKRVEKAGTILDRHSIPRINGELAVTRAFGDINYRSSGLIAVPEIQIHSIKQEDKYLILASDGFWDLIGNEDLQKLLINWQKLDINQLAQHLLEFASNRRTNNKKDNMTLIVVDIQEQFK